MDTRTIASKISIDADADERRSDVVRLVPGVIENIRPGDVCHPTMYAYHENGYPPGVNVGLCAIVFTGGDAADAQPELGGRVRLNHMDLILPTGTGRIGLLNLGDGRLTRIYIDWGDDSYSVVDENNNGSTQLHTYAAAGEYMISVSAQLAEELGVMTGDNPSVSRVITAIA